MARVANQILVGGEVSIADTASRLDQLNAPGCGGVIWRRVLNPELLAWLWSLDAEHFPQTRKVFRPDQAQEQVAQILANSTMPEGVGCDALRAEIVDCVGGFCALMRPPFLQLRLEVVDDDACRIFHMDNVTARMITTYRGPGTEFGVSYNGAPPEETSFALPGEPLILRGKRWAEDLVDPIVHRSPAIESTGQVRFLMVLDPLQTPDKI